MRCFACDLELIEIHATSNTSVHFRCPECRGVWWPGQAEEPSEAEQAWKDEQAYKKMLSHKVGGSKAGRKRKKPNKNRLDGNYLEV